MLDCNVIVGNWPFRKFRDNTIEKIEELHQKYGISGGFVSSAEAIFYNDPMEADLDLSRALEGKANYRHVVTVNPLLPGACANIKRAVRELNPAGVRIYPHYHGFQLHCPELEAVCDILREHKLPLFLNLRMDDLRAEYMVYSKEAPIWELIGFCQRHTDFPIIICNARASEYRYIYSMLSHQENICFDVCGFKDGIFAIESMYNSGMCDWLVYGSNAPVFVMAASYLIVNADPIPEDAKAKIMSGEKFINMLDEKYRPVIG